ncbi:DUF6193 family natural product biosynthesis protein [Streptomyces sp. A012304]|uniref:DUF6193 family natural product biosynthesis protein n=1 Tax=Streptomyces sp. A012304 TaxID=375446 RepID=UPI00222E81CA|nr:DUF6193 family natural product biosynthesis protein [Streptomyces sp. A012304]GKQ40584.1 hypothetical protein ALMP_71070 [Streptomyces sp. A012304]
MNSDLYPELAAAGGLAAALEQSAAGRGVDLTVLSGNWGALASARIASSVPEREPLSVHIGAESRWFGVSGWSQGIELITGGTPDLADVVRAGVAWGRGRSLREIRAELPFLRSGERAEAHQRGPGAVVESQWRAMRRRAAEASHFPEFGALVEAAHAEPRLRQLYVFRSHWTLGFSSCTGYPFRTEVAIAPSHGDSPYRVLRHSHTDVISEAATAAEAAELAVAGLPAGLGPAVTGTAAPSDEETWRPVDRSTEATR